MRGGIAAENGRERTKNCRAGIVRPTIYNLHVRRLGPPDNIIIDVWWKYRCAEEKHVIIRFQEEPDGRGDRKA